MPPCRHRRGIKQSRQCMPSDHEKNLNAKNMYYTAEDFSVKARIFLNTSSECLHLSRIDHRLRRETFALSLSLSLSLCPLCMCDMQMRTAPLHYLPLPSLPLLPSFLPSFLPRSSPPRAMNAKCPTTETIYLCPLSKWRIKAGGLQISRKAFIW